MSFLVSDQPKFSFRFGKEWGSEDKETKADVSRGVGKRIFGGRDGRYMKNPKI